MIEKLCKILSNNQVAPDTYLIRFSSPEIASEAVPGQFVMLRINEGFDPSLRRPFSICGVEGEDVVKILYKVVGKGTKGLTYKDAGDSISVLGPLGKGFSTPDPLKENFLVAGGIGIAPLLFLYQKNKSAKIHFLSGFRTSGEIIDPGTAGFDAEHMIATDDGSAGYDGRVTGLLAEKLEQYKPDDTCVYTCGPHPMLKAVRDECLKNNVPCQVSMETFMACGLGACQGCVVKSDLTAVKTPYLHVCKEGPVFDMNNIDWESK